MLGKRKWLKEGFPFSGDFAVGSEGCTWAIAAAVWSIKVAMCATSDMCTATVATQDVVAFMWNSAVAMWAALASA